MNEHIKGYGTGRFPAGSIQWVGEGHNEADVRDPNSGAVKHRVSLRERRCSCCRSAQEDSVCEHIVACALLAGRSPWDLVPNRYTAAEWREPYDAIAATGGFLDVTDDEIRAIRPELSDGVRIRAPVIMPNRRGGKKRIHHPREKARDAARGGRGGRGEGRGGGRGGGHGTNHLV